MCKVSMRFTRVLAAVLALAVCFCPKIALAAAGSAGESPATRKDASTIAVQAVVLKSSYTETMKLDDGSKDRLTFKMSTKKAYRKVDGDTYYAATLTKYKTTAKEACVPAVVNFKDTRLDYKNWPRSNVVAISAKAFKSCKAKELDVFSVFLTKKGVKNSLKGSKIKKVIVPKKCLKQYKKYFSKKNCGKKVKVVAFSGKLKKWPGGNFVPINAEISHLDDFWKQIEKDMDLSDD